MDFVESFGYNNFQSFYNTQHICLKITKKKVSYHVFVHFLHFAYRENKLNYNLWEPNKKRS